MKNLDLLVKNFLLTEALKIDSEESLIDAIKNKKLGVKIQPDFLQIVDECKPELKILYTKLSSATKNIQYPIGILLKQISTRAQLRLAVTKSIDSVIQLAMSYNKEWVKELDSFKKVTNATMFNSEDWHKMENDIQDNLDKHGKAAKGSGNSKEEVPLIYQDKTWELYKVDTFEKEKSIAFYGTNWNNPTNWCTRAARNWFDRYTKEYGEKYLWIIRKNDGHTWQMAFDHSHVEFMDEHDRRPDADKISKFLDELPDELCKKVQPNKGYTLYDIKHKEVENETKNENADVKIELSKSWSGSFEIVSMETPSNWGDIAVKNTKKIEDGGDYYNIKISDIANIDISFEKSSKQDRLEGGAKDDAQIIVKLIEGDADNADSKGHCYVIALFKNKESLGRFMPEDYRERKSGDHYLLSYLRNKIDSKASERHSINGYNLTKIKGAAPGITKTSVTEMKNLKKNPEYKKLINQIPFGELKSVGKFSTLSGAKKSPIVSYTSLQNWSYGIAPDLSKVDDYRVKNIIPKKVLMSFTNGNCYFVSNKMIFEPATEEMEEKEFEVTSKEAKAVKALYSIWLRNRMKDTKEFYKEYKRKVSDQQLKKDHEAWKKGEARLRPLGRIYEEIEENYFNY